MPYSGANDAKLPPAIKKLSEKARRQWIAVWQSEMDKHGDEGRAFAAANSVASGGGKGKKDWDDDGGYIPYEIRQRQIPQDVAGYDSIGGLTGGKACANCQWFLSPDECVVVSGTVAATGTSKLWVKQMPYQAPPMPVTIVDNGSADGSDSDEADEQGAIPVTFGKSTMGGFLKAVVDGAKSLLKPDGDVEDAGRVFGSKDLQFVRTKDGGLRFIATVTNNFQDRQDEILVEEAHKEYVEWADHEGKYPELWLWHAGEGSRWGQADMVDYVNGFLAVSGTVDRGKEGIAEQVSKEDTALSHGFVGLKEGRYITRYRMFECSVLPRWAAANEWTAFHLNANDLDGVITMPFTKAKRDYLLAHGHSENDVSALETAMEKQETILKKEGVSFKDWQSDAVGAADISGKVLEATKASLATDPPTAPALTSGEAPAPQPQIPPVQLEAVQSDARFKALDERIERLAGLLEASVRLQTKSRDETVADAFTAEISKLPKGVQASESNGNVVRGLTKEQATGDDVEWFNKLVGIPQNGSAQ